MKKINYLKIFFTTFLLTSCLIYDAHEVFKGDMSSGVGKSMDVALWANSKYTPVNSKKLKNGNIENEYEFRGTCRYFFGFDP